ncbi:MAG: hypothetical protein HZB29_09845 [Nitrospinae bacterium]|nr:hypothetical protein [Nitrospinota bacterium]
MPAAEAAQSGYDRYTEAYTLYVQQGWSLESVSEKTGVPISTLKSWSAKDGWAQDQRDFKTLGQSITRDLIVSAKTFGDQAKRGDKQSVFALLKIMRELRHDADPNTIITEFATALVTMLENDGHAEAAQLVGAYLQRAAEKVTG